MDIGDVPQQIKDSLFSERVDEILDEIRSDAMISNPTLIPGVFYDLIVKEIPAHYFIDELSEQGIGKKIAASVAKAVKERILESERYPLFRWGVDISEIKTEDAADIKSLGLKSDFEPEEVKRTIRPEPQKETEEITEEIPIIRSAPEPELKKESGPSPFILQEKPKEENVLGNKMDKTIPSFSFGFFKTKKDTVASPVPQRTIKAEVEIPDNNKKKVVHYMESRSTPSPFYQGGEFLKEEPLASPIRINTPPETQVKKEEPGEIVTKEEENKMSGPKIEGNIIDLRNNN